MDYIRFKTTKDATEKYKIMVSDISLLSDYRIKEESKGFLDFNANESYSDLWDAMKDMLRRKFIALSTFIKKLKKSHTSNLIAHLKALKQKKSKHTKED